MTGERLCEGVTLYEGDAARVLPALADASVDLVLTDPPYFGVKADEWDNRWATADEFLGWLGGICREFRRVLKPNGSLYLFASPRLAARVECVVAGFFNVLNSITWHKDFPCGALKYGPENFRGFVEMSERIIFAAHPDAEGYLARARISVGLSRGDVDTAIQGKPTGLCYRWEEGSVTPTREKYQRLSDLMPLPPYEDTVRPFAVSMALPYSDVWTYKPVPQAELAHPCEKPLRMFRDVIRISTRPGDVVLDCFAGTGTAGKAAVMEDRRAVLVEESPQWCATIRRRVAHAAGVGSLFESLTGEGKT